MASAIFLNLPTVASTTLCQTPETASPRQWAEYVFFHDNEAGVVIEWWCHTASSFWFLAERNTITDRVIRTFEASEIFQNRIDFAEPTNGEKK